MNRSLLFLFTLFLFQFSQAQNSYMTGYVISLDSTRIDGLIRNLDWKNNPGSIKFKETSDSDPVTFSPGEILEFGLDDVRYGAYTVEIDRTPENHQLINSIRDPDNERLSLFLKYVVNAPVSLLQYRESRMDRYFYLTDGSNEPQQLIYKKYYTDSRNVAENNYYQQQLLNNVNCGGTTLEDLERVPYSERGLVKYFIRYNSCQYGLKEVESEKNRLQVQMAIRGGMSFLKMTVWNYETNEYLDFPVVSSPLVGFEGEVFSNFNRGKWSIILGGSFHQFSKKITYEDNDYEVGYPSLEWTLGYRYYMHFSPKLSAYLNAMIVIDSPLDPSFTKNSEDLVEIQSRHFYGLGAGFQFNRKFKLDFRVSLEHGILADEKLYFSDYSGLAVTASYVLWRPEGKE